MSKVLTVLLAAAMVLSSTVLVFADDFTSPHSFGSDGGTITINDAEDGVTYTIYRIFDAVVGDESEAGKNDAPVAYSLTVNDAATLKILQAIEGTMTEITEGDPVSGTSYVEASERTAFFRRTGDCPRPACLRIWTSFVRVISSR